MHVRLLAAAVLLGALPMQASAQRQTCEIQSASPLTRGTTLRDEGTTFMGGGVFFDCPGGTTIRSDSLAHYETTGIIEFFGNVHYADTVKMLWAGYTQYRGEAGQVIARDSVVILDIRSGSTIRAPYLEYFQQSETRPEAMVHIPGGRPRAILIREAGDDVENMETETDARPDSTVIDSDAMDIYGERLFIGRGNVVVLRGDMQAYGDEAYFDQSADSMLFTGEARVVTDDYQLNGDTISALVTREQKLREVNAWQQARLESEDLRAHAPHLRILFEDGELNRLIAVGERAALPDNALGDSAEAEPAGRVAAAENQATAVSEDFNLVADSIDARAPGQQLERLVAVGDAFGERITPDTATVLRPLIAARDWMRGDTIIATFVESPDTTEDGQSQRILETITAVGTTSDALSLYAVPNDEDPLAPPSLSYLRAQRILVTLDNGEMTTVHALGRDGQPVHGVYLQPSDSARARPEPDVARDGRRRDP